MSYKDISIRNRSLFMADNSTFWPCELPLLCGISATLSRMCNQNVYDLFHYA